MVRLKNIFKTPGFSMFTICEWESRFFLVINSNDNKEVVITEKEAQKSKL